MPVKDPEFADIYGVATHVVPDAHEARRRNVVVHPRPDVVTLLGRTSQVREFSADDCLLSAPDDSCNLNLPGMLSLRFQHSILRRHFDNEGDCDYYGTLGEGEATNLREFWDRVTGF